ncbi:hypothetical protein EYC84_008574 [Monilinia fructicola]|uniref:PH domain-containing protein n=1 Tax=Monilinia fructicola TaxID=38448 RepID=A0A5M9JHP4_MONFR|nr:hypothetical protein EYC84_008574 [Monilinia fructicola]
MSSATLSHDCFLYCFTAAKPYYHKISRVNNSSILHNLLKEKNILFKKLLIPHTTAATHTNSTIMTSLAAKYISKKVLGESVSNKFGSEDLYFETVPASRLDGVPSKKKTQKRRKAIPAGISDKDAKILTKVKRRAYRLDMSLFNCCGIRFGWSSVIGLVPAIGDFIDLFMALMVFRTCDKVDGGLPNNVRAKMMFNIMLDFAVGLIPFAGDLVDAVFRANTRNALELERHLRDKGARILKAKGEGLPAVDVTDPDEFDLYDQQLSSDDEPPRYTSRANTETVNPRSQVDVIVTAGLVMAVAQSEQDSLTRSRVVEIDPNVQDSLSPSKVVAIDLSGPDSQSPSLHFQLVPRKLKRAVDVKRDYDFHLSGSWNVLGMFDILMPARFSLFVQ